MKLKEAVKTSAAKKRSKLVKEAEHGHKFAKKKANSFKNVEAKAAKEYGSEAAGKKVAGAVFWKNHGGGK
jgi:hypothetical protein